MLQICSSEVLLLISSKSCPSVTGIASRKTPAVCISADRFGLLIKGDFARGAAIDRQVDVQFQSVA